MRLNTREAIIRWAEVAEEDVILFEPPEVFDPAIVGIGRQFNTFFVVYDTRKVIENLTREMGEEDALDHFGFNVIGSWVGEKTPCFLLTETEEAE